jgi:hypothetical protein
MTHSDPQTSVSPSPTPDTAEQTNARPATTTGRDEPFDYYALIRRVRKSTGRL